MKSDNAKKGIARAPHRSLFYAMGYTDEELDDYGLNEWEKEEVKKGYQHPWNCDEEDLEDL